MLDKYPLAVYNTSVEDSPAIGITLDEKIDGLRLKSALEKALELFPLFKTKIIFDKEYMLEENDNPVLVFNENDYDKAFTWKKETNDYPFKITYFENTIYFKWCHAITDGRGATEFLKALLNLYYDISYLVVPSLELGLEPFVDKKEKGIKQKKQLSGFGKKGLKISKEENIAKCHVLKCKTSDVLALAKRSDASPATVIPPLFSMALRSLMKEKKNVKFSIVIDARVPLNYKTMHNCIITKIITYIDKYDSMDFELVSTIYRAILNLALEKENVIKAITEFVQSVGLITNLKCKSLIKMFGNICAKVLKSNESDCTFTYIGKIDFGKEVNQHIKDFVARSWIDFGYLNVAAIDLDGTFTINVTEGYENCDIVSKFIEISKSYGLNIEEVDSFNYYKVN